MWKSPSLNWVALEGKSVSQWKKRGHPWGVDVFTISPFGLGSHFLWLISGESESWVCLFCDLGFLSVTNQIPCDQGGMPKHVLDVWEEKIYTKLEVLSFEKAWDEIERDIFHFRYTLLATVWLISPCLLWWAGWSFFGAICCYPSTPSQSRGLDCHPL